MPEQKGPFDSYTFGIVGFGDFGSLLAELLPQEAKKLVTDVIPKEPKTANLQFTDLEHLVENSDIVFLAIPLSAYEEVLPKLAQTDSLVVDISSVKVEPQKLLTGYLGASRDVLITHPLFGPQTANNGLEGLKLIVTKKQGETAGMVCDYFAELGVKIVEMSAEEHDRQMAYTQVLTFFVSRALLNMNVRDVELSAPSFQKLLALEELESQHSEDLFMTIQRGNPYGKEVRDTIMESFKQLQQDIDGQNH